MAWGIVPQIKCSDPLISFKLWGKPEQRGGLSRQAHYYVIYSIPS